MSGAFFDAWKNWDRLKRLRIDSQRPPLREFRDAPPNLQWVKLDSLTQTDGRYDGQIYFWDGAAGAFDPTGKGDVWAEFANGITPDTSTYYHAQEVGFENGRAVFLVDDVSGSGGAAENIPEVFQARLSGNSSVAAELTDRSGITTVYLHPYKGRSILYRSSGVLTRGQLSGTVSLSLGGLPASTNRDIFFYNNAGTFTLESVAWSTTTARTTPLIYEDGLYWKSGDTSKLYVGTIRTTSSTGTTEDSVTNRLIWNYFNRIWKHYHVVGSGSVHLYNGVTRFWNGSSTNVVNLVVGLQEDFIHIQVSTRQFADSAGNEAFTYGLVSYTAGTLGTAAVGCRTKDLEPMTQSQSSYVPITQVGYHQLQIAQSTNTGNCNFVESSVLGGIWC